MNDLEQLKITQERIEKAQSRAESYYSQATSDSLKQCLKSVLNAIENTESQIQELSKNPGIFGRVISKNSDIEKLFSTLKNSVIEAYQKQSDINTNELAQFRYDLYLINSHEDLIESYANKEAYEQEVEQNELLVLEHQKVLNVLTQDHATETKKLRREIAELQQKFNRLNELEKHLKREKNAKKQSKNSVKLSGHCVNKIN